MQNEHIGVEMLSNVENFNHASFFPSQQGATDAVDVAHEENIKNTDKSPIGLPATMVEKHTDSQLALALDSCMSPFSRSASSNIIEPQLRQCGKEGSYADESLWIGETNLSMTASGTSWLVTPADSLLSGAAKGNNLNQATPGSDAPRLSARNNVYVSELPLHWNTDKLRSVCLAFGNIVSAKVVHDSATNRSREYGFVMFESEEQAALCVRSLNNCLMDGKILTCRLAHERAMPSFANTDRVAWSTSPSTPSPAIGFATPQQQALESMPLLTMRSTEESAPLVSQPLKPALSVSVSKRGSSSLRRSRNVFLQGLPLHWNTDKLRSLCGTFGKVELAKVVRDATTSLSCGHGFVLFENEQQATACVDALNGFVTEGRALTCRLAPERRSPTLSTVSTSDFTTSPVPQPLNPSGRTSVATEPLLRSTANVLSPQGIVDTVAVPHSQFVPTAAYGKWSTVGVAPTCPASGVHHLSPHAAVLSSPGPSFLGHTGVTAQQPQQPQPQQQGIVSSSLPAGTPVMTTVAAATVPGIPMQQQKQPQQPQPECAVLPGVEYHFAPLSGLPNTYIITFPYATGMAGTVLGSAVGSVAGAPSGVTPAVIGCFSGASVR